MQIYKNPVKLQNIFPVFSGIFSDNLLYAADPVSISGGVLIAVLKYHAAAHSAVPAGSCEQIIILLQEITQDHFHAHKIIYYAYKM